MSVRTGVRGAAAPVALLLALLVGVLGAGPASAAGVGDVQLAPAGEGTSWRIGVAPGEEATSAAVVRNVGSTPQSIRLYAAGATRGEGGGWAIGGDGSAPWIAFPAGDVTLQPGEERTIPFSVSREDEATQTGAVVLEVATASVVQRAATLVRTSDPTGTGVVPPSVLIPALIAAVVALAVAAGHVVARRRAAGVDGAVPVPA